jgi:hypothetical protein
MFASETLTSHLARGAIGLGALALSVELQAAHPWLLAVSIPVAVIALRGCPTCWMVGLVQTVAAKLTGRRSAAACIDGRCAMRSPGAVE